MICVEQVGSWIAGLAVLSILAVGILSWMGETPSSSEDRAVLEGHGSPAFGEGTEWGVPSPDFATDEDHEGHSGGNSEGWGRFTVTELCREEGVDLELATARLAAYELPLDADQRIRELADSNGYKPSEIVDILLGREPGAGCEDPDCDHDAEAGSGQGGHGQDHESGDGTPAGADSAGGPS